MPERIPTVPALSVNQGHRCGGRRDDTGRHSCRGDHRRGLRENQAWGKAARCPLCSVGRGQTEKRRPLSRPAPLTPVTDQRLLWRPAAGQGKVGAVKAALRPASGQITGSRLYTVVSRTPDADTETARL